MSTKLKKQQENDAKLAKAVVSLQQISDSNITPRNIRKIVKDSVMMLQDAKVSVAVRAANAISLLDDVAQGLIAEIGVVVVEEERRGPVGDADLAGGLVGEQGHQLIRQDAEGRGVGALVAEQGELMGDQRVVGEQRSHGALVFQIGNQVS